MKENKVARITKIILDLMFYGGFIVTFSLPWSLKWIGKWFPHYIVHYTSMMVFLIICAILSILIIWELRKIFKTVLADDCFVESNVESLRRMGYLSFGISFVSLLRVIQVITPALIIVMLVFLIAGLFSHVLAQVFNTAVKYKLENDLTI